MFDDVGGVEEKRWRGALVVVYIHENSWLMSKVPGSEA